MAMMASCTLRLYDSESYHLPSISISPLALTIKLCRQLNILVTGWCVYVFFASVLGGLGIFSGGRGIGWARSSSAQWSNPTDSDPKGIVVIAKLSAQPKNNIECYSDQFIVLA